MKKILLGVFCFVGVAAAQVGPQGAIVDGADRTIRATVLDYTSSNPIACRLTDTNGDYVGAGAGTQYTEDAAAAANPVGTALNLVRADTPAGVTTTDGDNVAARGTDKGELYVKHVDALACTQSGTWDEVGINDSGNSITVDNAQLSVVGGGTEAAAMRVTIASDSTGVLSVDDNGGTLTVDGTVTVTDGAGALNVIVDSSALPTGASTLAEQQTQTASLSVVDDWDNGASDGASVSGDVAHDSADAGEPVKIGAKAVASLVGQTPVAANDRSNLFSDLDGSLIVRSLTTAGDELQERISNTDGASTALSNFGATASQKNVVTDYSCINTSATGGYLDLRDGTAGAIIWSIPLPAGGGAEKSLTLPIRQPTANTALAYDVSGALTTVICSFKGFKSKQ